MKFIIALGLSLFCNFVYAQPLRFEYARAFGGIDQDIIEDIELDSAGNIYATGFFGNFVDFDPDTGTFIMSAHSWANGFSDGFISKYDSNGKLIWAKQFGGKDIDYGTRVALTSSGDIICGGLSVDSVYNLYSVYISRLDTSGNIIWNFTLRDSISNPWLEDLVTDDNDNVIICGRFSDTVDFDPGAGVYNMNASHAVYFAKYDVMGNLLTAKMLSDTFSAANHYIQIHMCIDNDFIYTTGRFTDTIDFDPGPSSYFLYPQSQYDGFICKYDTDFNFIWAKHLISPGGIQITDITASLNGSIYITGFLEEDTTDFDPGPGVTNIVPANIYDAFLACYDSSGNFIWVKTFGGPYIDYGHGIITDNFGHVYLTGTLKGSVDCDPGIDTFYLHTPGFDNHFFISAFDTSGHFYWAGMAESPLAGNASWTVKTDLQSNVYVAGIFEETADMDPGSNVYNATSAGYGDAFLIKLATCPAYQISNIKFCTDFVSPSGNYLWTVPGTYIDTLAGINSCDSIIVIHLSKLINDSVTVVNGMLNAIDSTVSYQWINCSTLQPVPGATNQSFLPATNDPYAVILTVNNCIDTSVCNILSGNNAILIKKSVSVYPNPSTGKFSVYFSEDDEFVLTVKNIGGEVVLNKPAEKIKFTEVEIKGSAGIYFLEVKTKNSIQSFKLVKF